MEFKELMEKMKRYEMADQKYLTLNQLAVIRVYGMNFRSITNAFENLYNHQMNDLMQEVCSDVCHMIPDVNFGYTLGDTIFFVLRRPKKIWGYAPWMNWKTTEMAAAASSFCTRIFGKRIDQMVDEPCSPENVGIKNTASMISQQAYFRADAYAVPEKSIAAYFQYKQREWIRHLAQAIAKSSNVILDDSERSEKELLAALRMAGIEWDSLPLSVTRGTICYKDLTQEDPDWVTNLTIPLFEDDSTGLMELAKKQPHI